MKAESKFNVGDTIYYMYGEQPIKDIVSGITFFVGKKKTSYGEIHQVDELFISYHSENSTKPINEINVYATKDELQKAIFANIQ